MKRSLFLLFLLLFCFNRLSRTTLVQAQSSSNPSGRTAVQIQGTVTFYSITETGEFQSIGSLSSNFGIGIDIQTEWKIPTSDDISVSPNGAYVAFVAYRDEQDVALFIYVIGQENLRQHSVAGLGSIKWSPDSQNLIIYTPEFLWGFPNSIEDAYLYNVGTDTLTDFLPTIDKNQRNFQWSDNQTLIYVGEGQSCTSECYTADIYLVDKLAKNPIPITDLESDLLPELPQAITSFYWSPLNEHAYFIITGGGDSYFNPLDYLYSVSLSGDIRLEAALPIEYANDQYVRIVGIHTPDTDDEVFITTESLTQTDKTIGTWRIISISSSRQVQLLRELVTPLNLYKSAISPDGQYLALNGYIKGGDNQGNKLDKGLVQVFDLASGEIVANYDADHPLCDIQWLNEQEVIFTDSQSNCAPFTDTVDTWVLDITTNSVTNLTDGLSNPVRLLPSPEIVSEQPEPLSVTPSPS